MQACAALRTVAVAPVLGAVTPVHLPCLARAGVVKMFASVFDSHPRPVPCELVFAG